MAKSDKWLITLSVMIFYCFNSLKDQPVILELQDEQGNTVADDLWSALARSKGSGVVDSYIGIPIQVEHGEEVGAVAPAHADGSRPRPLHHGSDR